MKRYVLIILTLVIICSCFCVSAFAGDSNLEDSQGRVPVGEQTVEKEVLRVTSSDTNGFHAVLLGLLGDYNPIAVTTAYQYPYGNGYQTRYQVDVEPDWSWICGAAIFAIVIYCVFRLIGQALGGIK